MLSVQTKALIRHHLGYPFAGLFRVSPAGGSLANGDLGFRYFQSYGFLEFVLDNLNPIEEAMITGQAVGSVGILGNPNPGDTVAITISNGGLVSPVTITYTVQTGDSPPSICNALSALALQNTALAAAGFTSFAPYGTGPFAQNATPLPEVSIVAGTGVTSFGITVTASGGTGAAVTTPGVQPAAPASTVDPTTNPPTILYGFLPILTFLEGAAYGSTQNLDTSKADVWIARWDEPEIRVKLYNYTRKQLSLHLSVPLWEDVTDYPTPAQIRATI